MSNNPEELDGWAVLKEPLHGIYIPSGLLLVGVIICVSLSGDLRILLVLPVLTIYLAAQYLRAFNRKKSLFVDRWTPLELEEQTLISKNSAIYRFKLKTHLEKLNIPVGHHVAVKVNIDGKDEIRYFNPINPKFDQGHLDLIVKSYPEGKVSKHFASLTSGELIEFMGPMGTLNYETNSSKEIGIIVGGSGITPALQILNEIITTPEDTTKVSLIYCNDTENDILLMDELDEMAEQYPYLDIEYVVRYPKDTWNGNRGLITKEHMERYLPEASNDNRLFICGPIEMNNTVLQYAKEMGWKHSDIENDGDNQVFIFQ